MNQLALFGGALHSAQEPSSGRPRILSGMRGGLGWWMTSLCFVYCSFTYDWLTCLTPTWPTISRELRSLLWGGKSVLVFYALWIPVCPPLSSHCARIPPFWFWYFFFLLAFENVVGGVFQLSLLGTALGSGEYRRSIVLDADISRGISHYYYHIAWANPVNANSSKRTFVIPNRHLLATCTIPNRLHESFIIVTKSSSWIRKIGIR